jgi:hypothetical protein
MAIAPDPQVGQASVSLFTEVPQCRHSYTTSGCFVQDSTRSTFSNSIDAGNHSKFGFTTSRQLGYSVYTTGPGSVSYSSITLVVMISAWQNGHVPRDGGLAVDMDL